MIKPPMIFFDPFDPYATAGSAPETLAAMGGYPLAAMGGSPSPGIDPEAQMRWQRKMLGGANRRFGSTSLAREKNKGAKPLTMTDDEWNATFHNQPVPAAVARAAVTPAGTPPIAAAPAAPAMAAATATAAPAKPASGPLNPYAGRTDPAGIHAAQVYSDMQNHTNGYEGHSGMLAGYPIGTVTAAEYHAPEYKSNPANEMTRNGNSFTSKYGSGRIGGPETMTLLPTPPAAAVTPAGAANPELAHLINQSSALAHPGEQTLEEQIRAANPELYVEPKPQTAAELPQVFVPTTKTAPVAPPAAGSPSPRSPGELGTGAAMLGGYPASLASVRTASTGLGGYASRNKIYDPNRPLTRA